MHWRALGCVTLMFGLLLLSLEFTWFNERELFFSHIKFVIYTDLLLFCWCMRLLLPTHFHTNKYKIFQSKMYIYDVAVCVCVCIKNMMINFPGEIKEGVKGFYSSIIWRKIIMQNISNVMLTTFKMLCCIHNWYMYKRKPLLCIKTNA